jgi:hypothetical protein
MNHYVEASARARVWLFAVCGLFLAAVLGSQMEARSLPIDTVAQLQVMVQERLLDALLSTTLVLALSFLVVELARQSIRNGRWPPPSIPMPFRTRIVLIASPTMVWVIVAISLAPLLLSAVKSIYVWYKLSQIVQSLAPAT